MYPIKVIDVQFSWQPATAYRCWFYCFFSAFFSFFPKFFLHSHPVHEKLVNLLTWHQQNTSKKKNLQYMQFPKISLIWSYVEAGFSSILQHVKMVVELASFWLKKNFFLLSFKISSSSQKEKYSTFLSDFLRWNVDSYTILLLCHFILSILSYDISLST